MSHIHVSAAYTCSVQVLKKPAAALVRQPDCDELRVPRICPSSCVAQVVTPTQKRKRCAAQEASIAKGRCQLPGGKDSRQKVFKASLTNRVYSEAYRQIEKLFKGSVSPKTLKKRAQAAGKAATRTTFP
eukprot:4438923-Amphidinium_carterae.1